MNTTEETKQRRTTTHTLIDKPLCTISVKVTHSDLFLSADLCVMTEVKLGGGQVYSFSAHCIRSLSTHFLLFLFISGVCKPVRFLLGVKPRARLQLARSHCWEVRGIYYCH